MSPAFALIPIADQIARNMKGLNMSHSMNWKTRLLSYPAFLCVAVCTAHATPVSYTFTATTRATVGSPAHLEQFRLLTPDFLPVVLNGPVISFLRDDPALISCVSCTDPPVPTLHFLRSGIGDVVQFRDADGILRPYFFPMNVLSNPGVYDTPGGFNVNVGKLVVAETETPEPATVAMVTAGLAIAGLLRRRLRS
jgi:hypothetical protein